MKKLMLFTAPFVLPFAFVQAKTVDFQQAADVAAKVIGKPLPQGGMGVSAVPESHLTLAKSVSAEGNYYVFNEADGKGFVIVAGDDVAKPVLGYADEGSYDADNLPPAMAYWLECLNREIAYAVQNNFPSNAAWENFSGFGTAAVVVAPLLSTTWNQTAPYSNQCPTGYTGCVATAMAQIMKRYNHPAMGTGSTTAYETTAGATVPAIDLAIEYDWGNMLPNYPLPSSGTSEQRDAVAQLMYYCGASVEMDYGLSSSGAVTRNVATALLSHFDYDLSISYKERAYYPAAEWEYILRQQLDEGMPVLYSGRNESSGHAFVCDGYRDDDFFHFNWGWGGYQDNYFVTTALNPGSGGAGSGEGTYNEEQYMIINIKPNEGGAPVSEMVMWSQTDMSSATTQIAQNTTFSVTTSNINRGFSTFTGYIGIALVDDENHILAIIGQSALLSSAPNYGNSTRTVGSVRVPTTIPSGNYTMKTVAITTADTAFMNASAGYVGELPLRVGRLTVTLDPMSGTLSGESTLTEATVGGGVDLPEATPCNSKWVFAGWSLREITELDDELDVITALIPAGMYVPEDNATLFAVYKQTDDDVYRSDTDCLLTSANEAGSPALSVYPNPAGDVVHISGANVISVELKDLSGRLLRKATQADIPVKDLQAGIYLLVIQTENGKLTRKMVKR